MNLQQGNKKKEFLVFVGCLFVAAAILGGMYYCYLNYFPNNIKKEPADVNVAQSSEETPADSGQESKTGKTVMVHIPSPFSRISDVVSPVVGQTPPNLPMPAIPAGGLTLDGLATPEKLKVKAIMTTDSRKMAVVMLPGGQVIDVKEGDRIENEGTVTRITAKGVYVGSNFFALAPAENTAPSLSSLFEKLKQ